MTRFEFTDRSSVHASAIEVGCSVGYTLHDEQIARVSGMRLSPRSADLITIALSCYTVDRLEARSARWWRELDVQIPVSDPDFWAARAAPLTEFLHQVTDDRWSFEFVAGRRPRAAETQLPLLPPGLAPDSSIGLFSGGLDSLAGAVRFLAGSDSQLLLIGVRSSFVIGRDQRKLVREMRRLWPGRVQYLRVPLRLQRAGDGEQTQRVRAFVYLTIAAVAALHVGLSSISVYENGIGAYNPRVAEFQWGSQSNLATHPETLRRFSELMRAFEAPVDVLLPHRHETKAEHVSRMPAVARGLIAGTASCDSYPLRRAGVSHCGTRCGSCILRRQSLLAAGLVGYDRTDYEDVAFESGAKTDAYRSAARQAWQFTKLDPNDKDTIQRLWPSMMGGSSAERPAVVDLFKRYGREWSSILATRPQVSRDCGWPVGRVA